MTPSWREDHPRDYYGCRMETVVKLREMYSQDYFAERQEAELRRKRFLMYGQELARMGKYVDLHSGGNVLDIGCGEGRFLSLFNDRWEKYGTEICEPAEEIARDLGIITDFELKDDFFDLIIFRGTIQAVPDPIHRIGECYHWLKDGGWIVFLSTPNTNSVVYKCFNNLVVLKPGYDLLLPSDIMLRRILTYFGFRVAAIEYPYLGSPYENLPIDFIKFFLALLGIKKAIDFAFFRYIMECYAVKA